MSEEQFDAESWHSDDEWSAEIKNLRAQLAAEKERTEAAEAALAKEREQNAALTERVAAMKKDAEMIAVADYRRGCDDTEEQFLATQKELVEALRRSEKYINDKNIGQHCELLGEIRAILAKFPKEEEETGHGC